MNELKTKMECVTHDTNLRIENLQKEIDIKHEQLTAEIRSLKQEISEISLMLRSKL
jgi:archaellum component FlaC